MEQVTATQSAQDLYQFPRPGYWTDLARREGLGPWEAETLTYSERRGGSLFGFGLVDNPIDTSPGEKRVRLALSHNHTRALVREWIDAGQTDAEIKGELERLQDTISIPIPAWLGWVPGLNAATTATVPTDIPADVRRRFGL